MKTFKTFITETVVTRPIKKGETTVKILNSNKTKKVEWMWYAQAAGGHNVTLCVLDGENALIISKEGTKWHAYDGRKRLIDYDTTLDKVKKKIIRGIESERIK